MKLAELGENVRAGLRFSINEARDGDRSPVVRFLLWHQQIEQLTAYR